MTVLAITKEGKEFLYAVKTAHKVNAKKADKIAAVLNKVRYYLNDGEIWYPYTVDQYDTAYIYGGSQEFIGHANGAISRRAYGPIERGGAVS